MNRRRRRWIRKRLAAGREVPRPLTIAVINCASVSFRPGKVRDIWQEALDLGADVILGCEMSDVNVKHAPGWQTIQSGPLGSPDSALVLGIRRDRGHLSGAAVVPAVAATREGGGIRKRPMVAARLVIDPQTPWKWSRRAVVGHAHPARAPRARRDYLNRFANERGAIKGGDLNISHRWAARLLGKRVHSAGVLHLAIPRWIPQTDARLVDIGSDHPALVVTLFPAKEKS